MVYEELDQSDRCAVGEKWLDLDYILKVNLTEFAVVWVWDVEEREDCRFGVWAIE